MVDGYFWSATLFEFRAKHTRRVEAPGELAVGGDGYYSSFSVDGGELFLDDLIGRGLQPHVFVLHQRADGSGDGVADEVFSYSRSGDGAGLVGGVGSGSDEGRVADAVPALGGESSGGGSGGDVAVLVEGDDAHGSVIMVVGKLNVSVAEAGAGAA